jgi:hypothetical protein
MRAARSKYGRNEVQKINVLTFLSVLALLAVVTACVSPASSESESPLATPASGTTAEATAAVSGEATAAATDAAAAEEPDAAATLPPSSPAATATYEPDVELWFVLLDPEYAFSVRYPTGWLIGEESVGEEDAPLVRAYTVEPADWESETSPVRIEIVEGDEEDFETLQPGYTDAEEQDFSGNTARVVELSEGDDAGTRYVFRHPAEQEWWVVIRVGGDDAGVTDLGTKMANSFRWGEIPEPEEAPETDSDS